MTSDDEIDLIALLRGCLGRERGGLRCAFKVVQKVMLDEALWAAHGNRRRAADLLGISPQRFYMLCKEHGMASKWKSSEGES